MSDFERGYAAGIEAAAKAVNAMPAANGDQSTMRSAAVVVIRALAHPAESAPTETATAAARKCIACNGTGEVTELYHEYAPTQVKCDDCSGSGRRAT